MLKITDTLSIPDAELTFTFARSGGPGGQNVNKLETKVTISFNVAASPTLTDAWKRRILDRLAPRINRDGILSVSAQDQRTQFMNRIAAEERLAILLRIALKPRKHRVPTQVSPAAREHRIQAKKRRGEMKRLRRKVE